MKKREISPERAKIELLSQILPSPIMDDCHYATQYLPYDAEIAVNVHLTALISGVSGDSVFYTANGVHTAIDYYREKGLDKLFLTTSYNLAKRQRTTIYNIIYNALLGRQELPKNPLVQSAIGSNVLCSNAALRELKIGQSFLETEFNLTRFGPGKAAHIAGVLSDGIFYPSISLPGALSGLAPFTSQPVVETCLRIPTYILSGYGQNRGLIREAFKDLLPIEVRRRQAKGEITSYIWAFIKHHRIFIKDYLCEGLLAAHGLVDKHKIQAIMNNPYSRHVDEIRDSYWTIIIESWLRAWQRAGVTELR